MTERTLKDIIDSGFPVTWACVDCGVDTAPGVLSAQEVLTAFQNGKDAEMHVTSACEIYAVRKAIWAKAGKPDGCLCVGCLEKRLGRMLRPKDFDRGNSLNAFPGTSRLMRRQKRKPTQQLPSAT